MHLALGLMSNNHPVLDVGCAYGLTSKEMLNNGFSVIANDLDEKHLNVLLDEVSEEQRSRLTVNHGNIMQAKLKENSLSGVMCFNVIHFLTGAEVRAFFQQVFKWLAPKGVFMVSVATPYLGSEDYSTEYYKKLHEEGVAWPGETTTTDQVYSNKFVLDQMPEKFHLIGCEVLVREAIAAGFSIFNAGHTNIGYNAAKSLSEAQIAFVIVIKN